MSTQWKWREGEISLKSFYELKSKEKEEYIQLLEKLPEQELSSADIHILKFYSKKKNNFISIQDELDLN